MGLNSCSERERRAGAVKGEYQIRVKFPLLGIGWMERGEKVDGQNGKGVIYF